MREGWEIKQLETVCKFQNGFAFKSNTFKADGTAIIKITNIQNGITDFKKVVYIDRNDYTTNLAKYEIVRGDLLIAMSGATTGKIGIHKSDEVVLLNQRVGKFEPLKNLDKSFLFYFLSTKVEESLAISAGSAQPNLSTEQIKSFPIPIPLLEEQKQIVAILDKAFTAIDQAKTNIEKNIVNAKELFQSKLNAIFSQKGEGWEEKSLGEVCEMIKRGIAPKYDDNQGLTIINQKCIRDHKINLEKSRKHNLILKKVSPEKLIKIGDVLVNSTGTGTLGRVAQVRDEEHVGCTVDTHVTIVRPVPNLFFIDFFGYAMIKIEDEITKNGEGASGQTELQRKKLEELFIINYPTSHETQKQLVVTLDALKIYTKNVINHYLIKINDIEELKKSILQKAFSGELTQKEAVV